MPVALSVLVASAESLVLSLQGLPREFLTDRQMPFSQLSRELSKLHPFLKVFVEDRQDLYRITQKVLRLLHDMITKRAGHVWYSASADDKWSHWLISAREMFRAICVKVSIVFSWIAHVPERSWSALRHFVSSCIVSTISAIKTILWHLLLIWLILTFIGLTIRITPYLVSRSKTVLRKRRMERENAERQSLLESQRRDLEEHARRARERAREQEDARRRQAENRARREQETMQRKVTEETEKEARGRHQARLCLETWRRDAEAFFNNIEVANIFPEPETGRCADCQTRIERGLEQSVLNICEHSLKIFLLTSGSDGVALRQEWRRWYPDWFTRHSAPNEMVKRATAMFQMLGILLSNSIS